MSSSLRRCGASEDLAATIVECDDVKFDDNLELEMDGPSPTESVKLAKRLADLGDAAQVPLRLELICNP